MVPYNGRMNLTSRGVPERIATKITVRDNEHGCWSWAGAHMKDRTVLPHPPTYPVVWWEAQQRTLHRVLYTLLRGPIPKGMVLDHVVCGDKTCCNPFHVEPETNTANMTRERREKETCKHGHSDWGVKGGRRYCRECGRIDARARQRRNLGIPEDWPVGKHFNRRTYRDRSAP